MQNLDPNCFCVRIPIEKGWSGDRKYRVEDEAGNPYLLRVSSAEQYARKEAEFSYMRRLTELDALRSLGLPICLPIAFGRSEEGVWSLQSWIDGRDAEEVLALLGDRERYAYGLRAGEILAALHTLPAPEDAEDWAVRFGRKIDRKLRLYAECPLKYEVDAPFLSYVAENRHLLVGRPQVMHHGDYHVGNMMIDGTGRLTVIDFNRFDHGDPWEEFNRIVWCAQSAPAFATGMVDGYFGGEVPNEFWQLLALYICSNTLSSLPWAIPFGEGEIRTMRDQAREVLSWYHNLTEPVPTWYLPPVNG